MKIKKDFLDQVAEKGVIYTQNYMYKAVTMRPWDSDEMEKLVPAITMIIRVPMIDGQYNFDYYEKVACLDNTVRRNRI